ncbi:hypothetical protein FACS189416_3810 [Bacteroidia bacterium]|nr:hypothetical protein FACS189416_3810 [Bacteroidia bacterium]
MQLSITYKELENQILYHFSTTVNISVIDDKTICISRKIVSLLQGKLQLHIESIEGTDVLLLYNGGFLTKSVINGVILFVKEKLASQVSFTEQNCATVHLAKIKDLDKIFDLLNLKDILFDTEKINLYLEFKNI